MHSLHAVVSESPFSAHVPGESPGHVVYARSTARAGRHGRSNMRHKVWGIPCVYGLFGYNKHIRSACYACGEAPGAQNLRPHPERVTVELRIRVLPESQEVQLLSPRQQKHSLTSSVKVRPCTRSGALSSMPRVSSVSVFGRTPCLLCVTAGPNKVFHQLVRSVATKRT